MAIKRWNANTSTWELVGTPGTVTPAAIGAPSLSGTNVFTGQNGFGLAPVGANRVTIGGTSFTLDLHRYTSGGSVPGIELKKSLSDTVGSHVAITSSSPIGRITAMGSDGANFVGSSEINFSADGTVSTGIIPGKITISTVNSSGASLERMRIDSAGKVGIGTSSPAGRLHVDNTGGNTAPLRVTTPSGGYNAFELVSAYTGNVSWGLNDSGGSGAMYFYQYNSSGSYVRSPFRIESDGRISMSAVAPNSTPVLSISNLNSVGTFNWSSSMMNASLTAGQNNIILIGKAENLRNSGYIGYKWNGDQSTSNLITFGHYQVDNVVNIDGNGYLLAGYQSSNGAYRLQVNSQIFATSSSIATSDGRYKENVLPITSGLDIIDSLNPVSFNWKEHPVHNFVPGKTVGFIAQEVKESLKDYEWVDNIIKTNTTEAVLDEEGNEITPAEEFLGIAESNIIPLLVAAVKELRSELNTLKASML